jgi:hypothetical protein
MHIFFRCTFRFADSKMHPMGSNAFMRPAADERIATGSLRARIAPSDTPTKLDTRAGHSLVVTTPVRRSYGPLWRLPAAWLIVASSCERARAEIAIAPGRPHPSVPPSSFPRPRLARAAWRRALVPCCSRTPAFRLAMSPRSVGKRQPLTSVVPLVSELA